MTPSDINQIEKASEFIYKGLNTKATPEKDSEYEKLVAMWEGNSEFQDKVNAIANGLKLKVVSATFESGAIVLPLNHTSEFSYGGLTEIRKILKDGNDENKIKRGTVVLGFIALLAGFFPDEIQIIEYQKANQTQSLSKITRLLVEICNSLKDQYEEEKEDIPEYLREGWEMILRLPPVKEGKTSVNSIEGIINILAIQLVNEGLLVEDSNNQDGKSWFPTQRFIAQAESKTVDVYEYCMDIHQRQKNMQKEEEEV